MLVLVLVLVLVVMKVIVVLVMVTMGTMPQRMWLTVRGVVVADSGYWNYAYLPRQLVVTVVSTALLVWALRIMPTCGTSDSGVQV